MQFTVIFFFYLLCAACASPLYLTARHEDGALISRSFPSETSKTVTAQPKDTENRKSVLKASQSVDEKDIIDEGSNWTEYKLKEHFQPAPIFAKGKPNGPLPALLKVVKPTSKKDVTFANERIAALRGQKLLLGTTRDMESSEKGVIYVVIWDRRSGMDEKPNGAGRTGKEVI